LYTAAWVGNLELIRFFVKQGADVNVKNQEGWTPVFAAVAQGHKHVVKALAVDYKCDVNVQSNQGTTPLYHAAEGGRYSITKIMLDAGADTELGKKKSWKPIHGAVYNYHAKVTALLIERGAKLDVHNSELKVCRRAVHIHTLAYIQHYSLLCLSIGLHASAYRNFNEKTEFRGHWFAGRQSRRQR
jgi:ankyrin repeat protein